MSKLNIYWAHTFSSRLNLYRRPLSLSVSIIYSQNDLLHLMYYLFMAVWYLLSQSIMHWKHGRDNRVVKLWTKMSPTDTFTLWTYPLNFEVDINYPIQWLPFKVWVCTQWRLYFHLGREGGEMKLRTSSSYTDKQSYNNLCNKTSMNIWFRTLNK